MMFRNMLKYKEERVEAGHGAQHSSRKSALVHLARVAESRPIPGIALLVSARHVPDAVRARLNASWGLSASQDPWAEAIGRPITRPRFAHLFPY